MMSGGWPGQLVWMMTWTSEISGKASSGMFRIEKIPASTSRRIPVKTRKRLRAHHSIHREITLHSSFCVHRELLGGHGLAVLLRHDRRLPGAAILQVAAAFVQAAALVFELDHGAHRRHAHGGHGGHKESDRDLGAGHRRAVLSQLDAERVPA